MLRSLMEGLLGLFDGVSRRAAERREIAEAAGLVALRVDSRGTVTGRDGSLTVAIRSGPRGSVVHEVVVIGVLPGLRIDRADLGSRLWEAVGARDLQVGDPTFDADLTLAATSPGVALALLDAPTRVLVRQVFAAIGEVTVSSRELTASLGWQFRGRQPFVIETVRALLALGHRLETPTDPEARLAAIAAGDPLSGVRANALATLVEEAPQRPETREALLAATRDVVPSIRLQAARALGPEGEDALHALASDTTIDDAVSAEAIVALGPRFERAQARSVLSHSVRIGRVETAVATLRVLAADGVAELPAIVDVLSLTHGPAAVAAAEALGAIGAVTAQAVLLEALRRHEPAVAVAAAHALGRCGTVAAVPDLKDAESRRADVSRAARGAIAAIQSRLTGATPGQVSLAGASGEVSVVDSTDGRVSLKADE